MKYETLKVLDAISALYQQERISSERKNLLIKGWMGTKKNEVLDEIICLLPKNMNSEIIKIKEELA